MVMGVVMIRVMPGSEKSAYHSIKAISGVLDVYHIFGEFDFFMMLQAEGLRELYRLMEEIQDTSGVAEARTILVGSNNGLQEHEPTRVLA
jgi:DNA-binding Lrp family transcriptional regulator